MMLRDWFKRDDSAAAVAPRVDGAGVVYLTTRDLISQRHAAAGLRLAPSSIRSHRSGGYLSPFKGRGMEFAELRPYQQGDDVRTLDWRVMARTGRPHTKLFREERERTVLLSIDLRQGMFFATRGAYKAVRAAQAAALLGWSAVDGGDRLGALLFDEREHQELRPSSGKPTLLHLFKRLGNEAVWQGGDATDTTPSATLHEALLRLRRVTPPGSLVFIASDFAGLDAACSSQLSQLARHNEVVLLFCFDPLESQLPPAGHYQVSDGRQRATIHTAANDSREKYHQRFQVHRSALEQLAHRPGIHLLELPSGDEPLLNLQRRFGVKR